jgi:hypothetical protein
MRCPSLRALSLLSLLLVGCGGELDLQPLPVSEPPPRPQPDPEVQYAPVATTPSPPLRPVASTAEQTQATLTLPQRGSGGTPTTDSATPEAPWVYSFRQGQWVYTADNGWIWIPVSAVAPKVDGVPYAFLFTPIMGWNWYVSPWGSGPYHYGAWVRHAWRPPGWRGPWIAPPGVVARLDAREHFRR